MAFPVFNGGGIDHDVYRSLINSGLYILMVKPGKNAPFFAANGVHFVQHEKRQSKVEEKMFRHLSAPITIKNQIQLKHFQHSEMSTENIENLRPLITLPAPTKRPKTINRIGKQVKQNPDGNFADVIFPDKKHGHIHRHGVK